MMTLNKYQSLGTEGGETLAEPLCVLTYQRAASPRSHELGEDRWMKAAWPGAALARCRFVPTVCTFCISAVQGGAIGPWMQIRGEVRGAESWGARLRNAPGKQRARRSPMLQVSTCEPCSSAAARSACGKDDKPAFVRAQNWADWAQGGNSVLSQRWVLAGLLPCVPSGGAGEKERVWASGWLCEAPGWVRGAVLCKERKAGTLGALKTVFLIVWLIARVF